MDIGHFYLEGNADAVEFCPHNSYHNVFAASTYTLQEGGKPSRHGSISLFDIDAETDRLDMVYNVEACGIFDIKWNPSGGHLSPCLAQADADGYLTIQMLQGNGVGGNHLVLNSSQLLQKGQEVVEDIQ